MESDKERLLNHSKLELDKETVLQFIEGELASGQSSVVFWASDKERPTEEELKIAHARMEEINDPEKYDLKTSFVEVSPYLFAVKHIFSPKTEPKQMVFPKEWEEFRASGLFGWMNMFLHTFGWVIAVDVEKETGKILRAYPARTKFRGFDPEHTSETYIKVSEYMAENAEKLLEEAKEE